MENKYRNIPTVVDGITFPSRLEARRYTELQLLKRAGEVVSFNRQVNYKIVVNGHHITTYRADFVVLWKDGEETVEDTKGVKTPEYKIKAALMKAVHGIEITEIFAKNKIKKTFKKGKKS